jgi:hypothetical protein
MHTPLASPARHFLVAALAVAALALGACGDSDEPAPPTTATAPRPGQPRLTEQEFVRAAAQICARTERDIRAFIPLGSDPTTRRTNRTAVLGIIRRQNDELHALGRPVGAPPRVFDEIYRSVSSALEHAEQDATTDIESAVDSALRPFGETLARYTPACR